METTALALIMIACAVVLVFRDWRLALVALSIQYFAVFILLFQSIGLDIAAVKLISGWMAVAILGATWRAGFETTGVDDAGILFKLFIFVILLLAAWSVGPFVPVWFPEVSEIIGFAGVLIVSSGLLRLGFHKGALQVVLCILYFFSGFELWFTFLESALLPGVMLGVMNLVLALTGAYLHTPDEDITPDTAELP